MLGGLSVITNECYTGVITMGIFTMGVQEFGSAMTITVMTHHDMTYKLSSGIGYELG